MVIKNLLLILVPCINLLQGYEPSPLNHLPSPRLCNHPYSYHAIPQSSYNNLTIFPSKNYTQQKYYATDLSDAQKLAALQQFTNYFSYEYLRIPYYILSSNTAPSNSLTTTSYQEPIKISDPSPTPLYEKSYIEELDDQLFIQTQCPEWKNYKEILDARKNTLESIKNGDEKIVTQQYTISHKMQRYCNAYNINHEKLNQCTGSLLQHTLHQEFITIAKNSSLIWYRNGSITSYKKLTKVVAYFTEAGIDCNSHNEIKQAMLLANTCWMILDCMQAVEEGLIDGAKHLINDITHPVSTTQNIIESAATCGYYIGKIAIEIGQIGYLAITQPPVKTHEKLEAWKENFSLIYESIQKKRSSLKMRDLVKEAVSLGIQCYTAPKILKGLGILFKQAHKQTIIFANNIPALKKTQSLTTPEGIIIRIAENSTEYMKSVNQQNYSSFIPEFIRENKVPRDKETILKNPVFRKTKIPTVKGAQVYTKENLLYHRDTFHKGKSAHLEVYNRRGLHLGEADPITGQLIPGTADKTKNLFK